MYWIGECKSIISFTSTINTTVTSHGGVGEGVKSSSTSPSPLSKEELMVIVVVVLMGVENLEKTHQSPPLCYSLVVMRGSTGGDGLYILVMMCSISGDVNIEKKISPIPSLKQ